MKELTAKSINVGLTKGWGVEEFVKNYGFIDIEELKAALNKIHIDQRKVNRDLKSMKGNSKRNKKRSSNTPPSETEEATYTAVDIAAMEAKVPYTLNVSDALKAVKESTQAYEETVNAGTAEVTITEVEKIEVAPVKNEQIETVAEKTQLELLNDKLLLVNERIMSCESSTKNLYSRKRAASKTVEEVTKTLSELESKVKMLKEKFEFAQAEHVEVEKGVEEQRRIMNDLQQEKETIMSQIRELMAVSLYCDSSENSNCDYRVDGIEIDIQLINARVKSFFESEVSDSELLDEFSVSELKKAAKVILAAEKLEEETKTKVELHFDKASNLTGLLQLIGKKVVII